MVGGDFDKRFGFRDVSRQAMLDAKKPGMDYLIQVGTNLIAGFGWGIEKLPKLPAQPIGPIGPAWFASDGYLAQDVFDQGRQSWRIFVIWHNRLQKRTMSAADNVDGECTDFSGTELPWCGFKLN
jgi:hypothetical protein